MICHALLCCALLCFALLCLGIFCSLCLALLCLVLPCYALLTLQRYALLCCALLCYDSYAFLRFALLCHAMLCYALCGAVLCYDLPCNALLCHEPHEHARSIRQYGYRAHIIAAGDRNSRDHWRCGRRWRGGGGRPIRQQLAGQLHSRGGCRPPHLLLLTERHGEPPSGIRQARGRASKHPKVAALFGKVLMENSV